MGFLNRRQCSGVKHSTRGRRIRLWYLDGIGDEKRRRHNRCKIQVPIFILKFNLVCSEGGKERADARRLSNKTREIGKKDDVLERQEEMA